ncbi:hypothetical protein IWX90DRAFT_313733 [Phyllosticta citrichinensis]|uniref:Zn(2)-C6 fungal-type domain-containing protein n=1 Tax=Phyllosticta citrichinensis TaxID=1130410 RepID=A0ABR1XM41_9PEZI
MPDDTLQDTPNSSRRSHTPEDRDDGAATVRKRRRIALSCYDCRRRKLRCDREYPACGRCRKGGHAETCSYDSRAQPSGPREAQALSAGSEDEHNLSPSNSNAVNRTLSDGHPRNQNANATDLLAFQRQKISELESRLAQLEGKANQPTAAFGDPVQHAGDELLWPSGTHGHRKPAGTTTAEESETMLLRGKAFKTAYFGRSNITSVIITHFPGLRPFMQSTFKDHPNLMQTRPDMKALRESWKKNKQIMAGVPDLAPLLPPKNVVDELLRVYFQTLETTFRILHVPTFWEEYSRFWTEPTKRREGFIATILAVLATVITAHFNPPTTYQADRSMQFETASEWVTNVEEWLKHQSQKHTDISHFQIRVLLLCARCVNSIKWKEIWPVSRNLVTFALSTGLHRDPGWLVKETTVYDQEMRCRLWATIVELELQCSIYRGMPSSTQGLFVDAVPPMNLNDEDMDATARKAPPTAWPSQEYTSTSYLHIASRSFGLRTRINNALNNSARPLSYEDTMAFAKQIVEELGKIPPWTGRDGATLPRILLDIQLRQYLVLLHEPFARKAGTESRYTYSRTACFDAAASVIEQHHQIMTSGIKTILLPFWNDIARSAISIIHSAFTSGLAQDYRFFQDHHFAIAELVEKALQIIEEKTVRTGAGFGHLGHISAAYDLLITKFAPEEKDKVVKHNVERVLRLHNTMVSNQKPLPQQYRKNQEPPQNLVPVQPIPTYSHPPGMPAVPRQFQDSTGAAGPPVMGFPDIQGWSIDDIWGFGPIEL